MVEKIADFLVIGAGPAGILAQQVLRHAGHAVTSVDHAYGVASPQSAHVHFFDAESLCFIEQQLPGFMGELKKLGCTVANKQGTQGVESGELVPWPTREIFDRALYNVSRECSDVSVSNVRAITFGENLWHVELGDGRTLRGQNLIDASGRSRRSLNVLAALAPDSLVIHEGPATGQYISCTASGVKTRDAIAAVRIPAINGKTGAIALKVCGDLWQVTFQLAACASHRTWKELVGDLPTPESRDIFLSAEQHSRLRRYGGQKSNLLQVDSDNHIMMKWLPVGDAIYFTPPYQGNGLRNLVMQIRILADNATSALPVSVSRDQVFSTAHSAWLQSTMMDALCN